MERKVLFLAPLICFGLVNGQGCPSMTSPLNEDTEVSVTTTISWSPVEGASGYFLLVGTTPGGRDLIDRLDVGNKTTYELPDGESYPANTLISVKITIRFPDRPDQTCPYELFTTGNAEPQQGCSHFINSVPDFLTCDLDEDNFEEFNIDLSVLERSLIGNQTGLTVTYHNPGGDQIDFSVGTQFAVNQRMVMARATDINGCSEETFFSLIVLPPPKAPVFDDIFECETYILPELDEKTNYFTESGGRGTQLFSGKTILTSQRIYIYAEAGDCEDQSNFEITIDPEICEEKPKESLSGTFPKFFTPNDDGFNDFWQYVPPAENSGLTIEVIHIYDRYGTLLSQIQPDSKGWDGTFNGRRLPSTDYWFKAITQDSQEVVGHFSLKR